jgi:hypothetical protein
VERKWHERYPQKFRCRAVERMNACDNIVRLARELGVSRTLLYKWRPWSRIAPPSELPCRWSNFATTGRSKISGKRRQSVVVCSFKRRPHFWCQTRVDNGFVP